MIYLLAPHMMSVSSCLSSALPTGVLSCSASDRNFKLRHRLKHLFVVPHVFPFFSCRNQSNLPSLSPWQKYLTTSHPLFAFCNKSRIWDFCVPLSTWTGTAGQYLPFLPISSFLQIMLCLYKIPFPSPRSEKNPALQTKHLGFNLEIILGNLSWIHFPNVLSEKLQPDGAQESSAPLCSFQLWYNLSPTAKELFSGCFLPQPLPASPWRHSSVMQTALGKRFL